MRLAKSGAESGAESGVKSGAKRVAKSGAEIGAKKGTPCVADNLISQTQAVVDALQAAVNANEKVVLHCWGGGGRTGRLLAAFLVAHYKMTPQDAATEVMSHAKKLGASRRVDVSALEAVLPKA
eukprot:gene284-biopygen49